MRSAATDPCTSEAALAASASLEPAFSNTILVADDDPATLKLLEYMLTRAGYESRLATDGEQALGLLAECRPALVLLDCDLPELDGLEVCRRIKRDPSLAGIPVIFLTILSSPADKARGYAAGGDDYISKPLDRVELLNRIRKQLELSRMQAQVHRQAVLLNAQAGRADEAHVARQLLMADVNRFKNVRLALHYRPAIESTGDFYDVQQLTPEDYGLLIAEVAGPPMQGGFLVGAMKAFATTFLNSSLSVQESLVLMNSALRKCLGAERRVNACYARYDIPTRQVEIGCAGTLTPLLLSRDGSCRQIEVGGDPLAAHDEATFETEAFTAETGQRLFMFTTGFMQDGSGSPKPGGIEAIKSRLLLHRKKPLAEAIAEAAQGIQADIGAPRRDHLLLGLEC